MGEPGEENAVSASGCLTDLGADAYQRLNDAPFGTPGMSNYDDSIDPDMEAMLATGATGDHSGWEFNGRVVFRDGIYVEWVRRYHQLVCRHTAPTLRELMDDVNNAHGWD